MNTLTKRSATGALAGAVESVWALPSPSPSPGECLVRLPTVRSQLIWPLPQGRLWLQGVGQECGARSIEGPVLCLADTHAYMVTHITPLPQLLLGVDFAPGGAQAFLPAPIGKSGPAPQALANLWGSADVEQATQRLVDASRHSVATALAALETELQARWRAPDDSARQLQHLLAALQFSVDMGGGIAGVAHQLGMNDRQLREKVRSATGLAPKRYARLQRFTCALRGMNRRSAETDAALAIRCGYFDQAHFIHEFKAMAGMTPSEYRRQRGEGVHSACLFTKLRARLAAMSWPERWTADKADIADDVRAPV